MDTDVMDDLFYDSAEGMAEMGYADDFDDEYDDFDDEYDDFDDEYDDFDDFYDAYDDDEYDGFDDFYDAYDDLDAFDDDYDAFDDDYDALDYLVADALASYDTDEFFKKFLRKARKMVKGAARVAAPLLSKIPLPQTQALAKLAKLAGQLLADGADELEALDTFVDFAEYEGDFDAVVPVIAGLTIKKTMPSVARLQKGKRVKMLRAVKAAAKMLARRQGVKATKAMPVVLKAAKKVAQRTGQPVTKTIPKTTAKVAKSPTKMRRIASKVSKVAKTKKMMKKGMKYPYGKKKPYGMRGPLSRTCRCR